MVSLNGALSYWELVLTRLETGEMPPDKVKKHPTSRQRDEVVAWLQALGTPASMAPAARKRHSPIPIFQQSP